MEKLLVITYSAILSSALSFLQMMKFCDEKSAEGELLLNCLIPHIIKMINLFTRSLQVVRVLIMANF